MDQPHPFSNLSGQRIVIIGTTGSGKTTLAAILAQFAGVPHIELDALHWGPGWTEIPLKTFRTRTLQVVSGPAWVADGNYGKVRDIVWGNADTLVWLDYPLTVILGRLLKRTIRRVLLREELWNGNRETFRNAFLSQDSLFIWALNTQKRWRQEYPALLALPEYQHLTVIRFRSPRQTAQWLRANGVFTRYLANTPSA